MESDIYRTMGTAVRNHRLRHGWSQAPAPFAVKRTALKALSLFHRIL